MSVWFYIRQREGENRRLVWSRPSRDVPCLNTCLPADPAAVKMFKGIQKKKSEVAILNNKAQREDRPPVALAEPECQTKLGKKRKIDRKTTRGDERVCGL